MGRGLDQTPAEFAESLRRAGLARAFVVDDPETGALRVSHPLLEGVARAFVQRPLGFAGHEAVFLAVAPRTGALFGAFVHSTVRGQAQGGVRRWRYPALEEFLRDGLRLSQGMSRKSALAGLWWGGGKGVIACGPGAPEDDPAFRATLYEEYGEFVTSLRGCFLAAEDVGTTPSDVERMFTRSRFVTCVPPELGGRGNPSPATALGVVAAMEAGLACLGRGGLAGKRVAVQGCGQVGRALVARLLERGVASLVAADPDPRACQALRDAHPGAPLEVRAVGCDDRSALAEPCDVLAPCALGGVLDPKTIPGVRAALVCGSANNQLACEVRDDRALFEAGITWIPDPLCSRMGIVYCGGEPWGLVPDDPDVLRHLDPSWPGSIPAMTKRVLARARDEGVPPGQAACALADEALREPHPLLGHRGRRIVAGLVADRWAAGRPGSGC
jgi:glutamate dehydrogenase/leucine dehydrogenase